MAHLIKYDDIQRITYCVFNINGPDISGCNVDRLALNENGNMTLFVCLLHATDTKCQMILLNNLVTSTAM